MAVPYTFGSATTSIPLSQLDSNFATTITLGNTAVQLGNTITNLTGVSNVASATSLSLGSNGNTTAITVDTSQNVGIGTASPVSKMEVAVGTAGGSLNITNTANTNTAKLRVTTSQSSMDFGEDGTGGFVEQLGAYPIRFYNNNAERMRIETNGNFFYGYTSGDYANSNSFKISTTLNNSGYIIVNHLNGSASGNVYAGFGYNGSAIGTITQNGTTGVLYNLTSDYRLKNNPVALTGAKDFVMALQPKKWQWWDGSGEGVGFVAHEFMEVAKYSGNGTKDAVDDDGKPIYQSIQPSSSEVMANMVALMQEQQATINALTARIVALEAK